MLDEKEYVARAQATLARLIESLDEIATDGLEAELSNDIVTVEFGDGTKYIINSHRAARQIWMAADRTAWHFDWVPGKGRWIAAKTGDELKATVEAALSRKLGRSVVLSAALEG